MLFNEERGTPDYHEGRKEAIGAATVRLSPSGLHGGRFAGWVDGVLIVVACWVAKATGVPNDPKLFNELATDALNAMLDKVEQWKKANN